MPAEGAPPERTIVARWQDWSGTGIQHLVLSEGPRNIVAEAAVLASQGGSQLAAWFRIECDATWRATAFEGRLIGDARRLELASDGAGHWRDGAGTELPHLDGAIDVDLPLTPFTNTLPIRRLALGAGALGRSPRRLHPPAGVQGHRRPAALCLPRALSAVSLRVPRQRLRPGDRGRCGWPGHHLSGAVQAAVIEHVGAFRIGPRDRAEPDYRAAWARLRSPYSACCAL